MKDKTKILASLFRKWRKENNFTYYQIKKEEGDSIRVDQLARIEKGQEVTTKKLLSCIHFCHEHGYDILADLWNYKETPSPYKKNDKKTGEVQSQETPPSESSIDRTQALQTGTENTSTGKEINEVPEEGYGESNESEMNDLDYSHAQRKFKDGEQLDKDDQLQFIRNGRCPKCGKTQLVQKVSKNGNTYTKCQDYNCGYWFMGTRNNPKIYKEYENGVTPLGSK